MFDREIKYINENGIAATANMLRDKIPGIEKYLKEYTPRTEKIKIGISESEKCVPEDSFGEVSFILKYYPEVISGPDFDKYAWITYLYYVHVSLSNIHKNWNNLSEILENSLVKNGEVYDFFENESIEDTLSYSIGPDPLARTSRGNPFYKGLEYDNPLMRTRYKDVSPKDEQIICKFHVIPDELFGDDVDLGLVEDFSFKRDSLYEALLYNKADWEYNKIVTDHFVGLIQNIFRMQYPVDDSMINLADINTYSRNSWLGWHTLFNLVGCIFNQSTAFILYNWYLMDKNDEERLNLFIRFTWVIQRLICDQNNGERIHQSYQKHTESYVPFGADSMDEILEIYQYTSVQNKKASEVIREIKELTERTFEDGKKQIEELLEMMKEEIDQFSDEDLLSVFVEGKKSVCMLKPNSKVLYFPFLPTSIFELQIGSDEERRGIPGSVKYTFLKDFEGYGNAVDLHGFFCEDAYDEEISDWVIQVYGELLKGGGANQFASNHSYQEFIAGEKILGIDEYGIFDEYDANDDCVETDSPNMCDFFAPDTNFRPYQDVLKKTSIYQIAHNNLYKIFHIKGRLGLALENCCWINDFLFSHRDDDEYDTLLESLIASIREYVYGASNTVMKVKYNTEITMKLNEKVRELQKIREAAAVFRNTLLYINDKKGLTGVLNCWTEMYSDRIHIDCEDYEDDLIEILYNEMLTGLTEALGKISENADQLQSFCADNKELFDRLERGFDKLYQGVVDKDARKRRMISETQKLLSDASSLYALFVSNSNGNDLNVKLNDYSPIALNYYRALEFLVNQMFYIPYKEQVLECNQRSTQRDYVGNSRGQITKNNRTRTEFKPSLEMRTFAIFMGGLNFRRLLPLADYPVKLKEFLVSRGVDLNKFRAFCLNIYEVGDLRNACAHPTILDESYAVKAKTVVYEHNSSDDAKISNISDAWMIYELIIQLSNLVS